MLHQVLVGGLSQTVGDDCLMLSTDDKRSGAALFKHSRPKLYLHCEKYTAA